MRVAKLIMVTDKNNNKFYNMTEQSNGTIAIEYGRVDGSCQTTSKSASQWDKVYNQKVKKGYKDVTHLVAEEDDSEPESQTKDIDDQVIDQLFKQLQAYANHTIKTNYKISSHKVTQAMVDEAQTIVDNLAKASKRRSIDLESFNQDLLELFHVIPRKMKHVKGWLVDTSLKGDDKVKRCQWIVDKEQSTLDVMAGQVVVNSKADDQGEVDTETKKDLLELLGLEVSETSAADDNKIRNLMAHNSNQFKRAYKVINRKTEDAFNNYMETVDNKQMKLFWHGSRNENWLNILSTGLLIRPSGAVHSGSMFGDGIYFADKAQKSIGYTSLRGSYWAGGSANSAFLALFTVHVGKQKEVEYSDSRLNKSRINSEGYDSVYAKAGRALMNNEYIIYDSNQCTVSYLIEISS